MYIRVSQKKTNIELQIIHPCVRQVYILYIKRFEKRKNFSLQGYILSLYTRECSFQPMISTAFFFSKLLKGQKKLLTRIFFLCIYLFSRGINKFIYLNAFESGKLFFAGIFFPVYM